MSLVKQKKQIKRKFLRFVLILKSSGIKYSLISTVLQNNRGCGGVKLSHHKQNYPT